MSDFDTAAERCPLCSSSVLSRLYTIDKFRDSFSVSRCGCCGFIFMNPAFSDEKIRSFYTEDYYTGSADYSYTDERASWKAFGYVWKKRIDVLKKYVPSGKFLDVGAAFGGFMAAAGSTYEPFGIELSPFAAGWAAKIPEATVHCGTLDDHPFPAGIFSVITMVELIEHLKNPVKAVNECFKLLKKGGVLLIQTANMDGMQAKLKGRDYGYFLPGHVSYFTKRNLTQTLKKAGFTKVKVFQPVDFGLLPKLRKASCSWHSIWDYRHGIRIALYHGAGKIHFRNFCPVSSMVVYAFK